MPRIALRLLIVLQVLAAACGGSLPGGEPPRERTLVITPWGATPEIKNPENYNIYLAGTYNQTYWKGWPSAEDPYVAPYPPWEAWRLIVHRIQPVK